MLIFNALREQLGEENSRKLINHIKETVNSNVAIKEDLLRVKEELLKLEMKLGDKIQALDSKPKTIEKNLSIRIEQVEKDLSAKIGQVEVRIE